MDAINRAATYRVGVTDLEVADSVMLWETARSERYTTTALNRVDDRLWQEHNTMSPGVIALKTSNKRLFDALLARFASHGRCLFRDGNQVSLRDYMKMRYVVKVTFNSSSELDIESVSRDIVRRLPAR